MPIAAKEEKHVFKIAVLFSIILFFNQNSNQDAGIIHNIIETSKFPSAIQSINMLQHHVQSFKKKTIIPDHGKDSSKHLRDPKRFWKALENGIHEMDLQYTHKFYLKWLPNIQRNSHF